jgi:hypothetical protein
LSEHELVYVKWLDASSQPDQVWSNIDEAEPKLVVCHSVGFVLKETKEYLSLMMNMTEFGQFSGDMAIPQKCIIERKSL